MPKRGAPVKYTHEVLEGIKQKIITYTKNTEIPILAECATQLDLLRQTLYEHEELSDAIKKLIQKKSQL